MADGDASMLLQIEAAGGPTIIDKIDGKRYRVVSSLGVVTTEEVTAEEVTK